jgi:SAM-dependent methyltransferase
LGLDPKLFSTEITTGVLINHAKRLFYPVHDGVPRMFVFHASVFKQFAKIHAQRLRRELPGYELPHETPVPGEETVLRTFSREWLNYDWDDKRYWCVSPDVMYKITRFLLDLKRQPIKEKLVLEVGIGIGGIADYMAREEGAEVIGLDLSYSVDPAYHHFGKNPFLHILQGSLFTPEFPENAFDLVYSIGVLHHTFSTKVAFEKISKLPKKGGRLYVWVYSRYDEERSPERRVLMKMESLIRPIMWRLPAKLQNLVLLPIVPLYLFRQNVYSDRSNQSYVRYGFREAIHAARDRFTPRYAYRQSEDELREWFIQSGYTSLQSVKERHRPNFVPEPFVFAASIGGVRQ